MSYLSFIIYPVIGAFVGAFTNAVAIKLLFWPRRPFLGIQGLLPKRRSEIAQRAGELVNGYLVNSEAIRRRIDRRRLDESIDRFLSKSGSRLWDVPLMKRGVKKVILSVLLDKDGFFNKNVIESFIDEGMVSGIVEQKIAELSSFNQGSRDLQRLYMGYATECEMDGQGRILLPAKHIKIAKIDKRVAVVGQGKKLEIWDEDTWDRKTEEWLSDDGLQGLEHEAGIGNLNI